VIGGRVHLPVDAGELEGRGMVSEREVGHGTMLPTVRFLYDAVAFGMLAYSQAGFRVTTLGPARFEPQPGTLIVVAHRRETDAPLVCPPLYFGGRMWGPNRALRMHFAAREDMFLPGFFAGLPPGLAPRARRFLFRLGVGRWLPVVQVHSLRSATVARLGEVLRARRDDALGELLTPDELEAFRLRAAQCGASLPGAAGEVLRGEYADLLWRPVTPAHPAGAGLERFWSARAANAAADFRALVELVRGGGVLVVFPEGRPSPDGEIGPIQRGLSALVRRARPSAFLPVALAYDALGRGRTRVSIALGDLVEPPEEIEAGTLTLLRRTMPLTCGQVVANALATGEEGRGVDVESALAAAVETARAEGRPIEPDLLDEGARRRRLEEALAVAPSRPDHVAFLAREYRSSLL
jgi:1-acyl-sn-glycerol-3-phosphate acyltransferase